MHCCGIVDVEGMTISAEGKVFQALHGIYVPHSKDQHSLLSEDFPAHPYRAGVGNVHDDFIEIPYEDMRLANEYDTDHLMKAFPTLSPYGGGDLEISNEGSRYHGKDI